jgi:hypothetical protein
MIALSNQLSRYVGLMPWNLPIFRILLLGTMHYVDSHLIL